MAHCPPTYVLERLLADQLGDRERKSIECHVEDCVSCQEALHELTLSQTDPDSHEFLSKLSGWSAPGAITEADVFVRQLTKQVRSDTSERSSWPWSDAGAGDAPPEIEGYEITEELGRGAVGIVYRARDRELDRPVALKLIHSGPHLPMEARLRLRVEARAIARLRHPNIVQVFDFGEQADCQFLALELVDGVNLARWFAGMARPADEAARILATLAEALEYAHSQGVIHRDLKPANVLVGATTATSRGDGSAATGPAEPVIKITDFGLAKISPAAGLADDQITQSGTILGTPAYVAPEQAQGNAKDVGPAADIYSLGAILYELLTGRPPFVGANAVETLLQVVHARPVPPRRLVPLLPRPIETICLKCLEKDPRKRYATASDLAADLRRFLGHEPILARPAGLVERGLRWVRRRPTQAALVAGNLLFAIGLAGGGLWLSLEQASRVRSVEREIRESEWQRDRSAWEEARANLRRAEVLLGNRGPAELHRRLDQARRDLEQAQRDVRVAPRLDAIHLTRATFVSIGNARLHVSAERRCNRARADREYEEAFREIGFGVDHEDPRDVAARVASSIVRGALVAGLDDWALCAADRGRRDWLLVILRRADPDAWRDRARDPSSWEDPAALVELSRDAPVAEQPVSALISVAERLQLADGDATSFLKRVQLSYPDDFWVNFTLANVLSRKFPGEAVAYYQKSLAVRPRTAAIYNNLGLTTYDSRRVLEAVAYYDQAISVDRDFAPAYNNLGLSLKDLGPWHQAIDKLREAVRLDPKSAQAHLNLAEIHAVLGDMIDAGDHCRKALAIDPAFAQAHYRLGVVLSVDGRLEKAIDDQRQALLIDPKNRRVHDKIYSLARDDALDRYQRAIAFDPMLIVSPFNLGAATQDEGRSDESIDHFKQAIRLEPALEQAYGALGRELLARGHFREADEATRRCLERLEPDHRIRANVARQLQRIESLLVLEGKAKRDGEVESLDLAELCFRKDQYVAAARLYARVLEATPSMAEDPAAGRRYNACRAAILAGFGRGEEGGGLGPAERAGWLTQARRWLREDLDAWANTLEHAPKVDRDTLERVLANWHFDSTLSLLRKQEILEGLAPAERQECLALWRGFYDLFNPSHDLGKS